MTPAPRRPPARFNTTPVSAEEFRASQAADMKETPLQEGIIALADRLGWIVYHTYDSRRSEAGYPDLHLVHAASGRSIFRELKTMKGRLSPDQRKWLAALAACGIDAGVWRPDDFVSGRIRDELTPVARKPVSSALPDLAAVNLTAIHPDVLKHASRIDLAKGADCVAFAARVLDHGGKPPETAPADWPRTLGRWRPITNPNTGYALAVAYLAAAGQKESTR